MESKIGDQPVGAEARGGLEQACQWIDGWKLEPVPRSQPTAFDATLEALGIDVRVHNYCM